MTMPLAVGGAIVRIVDLTFRITGISEQNERIQDMTRRANILVTTLTTVLMLQRLIMAGMGPAGWIMMGATVAGVIPSVMNEFSDKEEAMVRGR